MTPVPPNEDRWVFHPKARVPHSSRLHRGGWDRRPPVQFVILPLAAFLATLPLILHGASCGHDFDFHILNWMEAARQFSHGQLNPHWAFTPAYNAGEPRFVFYPPLSWTIGAILSFLMPWAWTPIAYTWLALSAAGFALYRLAREFASQTAALLAATFYLVNPYTLFTAYERTAYAELLAAAWIPLLLLAILRERVTIPRIAIPVALLWLTDAPAAVMGCYALALLTLVRLFLPIRERPWVSHKRASRPSTRLQLAATTTAGTLLGLGLAAFYVVPAAWERRYVQIAMAILPEMSIQNNFLFRHTSDPLHDVVLHTASTIAVILLVLTAIVIAIAIARSLSPISKSQVSHPSQPHRAGWERQPSTGLLYPIATLAAVIAFLLTPPSNLIWQHLPELKFLQFPWRLLAILAAVLSLAIALILNRLKFKSVATAILAMLLAATLAFHSYNRFQQSCDDDDSVSARLALFHSNAGTEPTDEYTPTIADNDSLSKTNPPFWLVPNNPSGANQSAPANSIPGPAPRRLTLDSTQPKILVLNLRDYPAWHITLNQTSIATRLERDDGLIAFPIPAGLSHIRIDYVRTVDETLGDSITVLSCVVLLFLRRKQVSFECKP
jgi:hypothetical protein